MSERPVAGRGMARRGRHVQRYQLRQQRRHGCRSRVVRHSPDHHLSARDVIAACDDHLATGHDHRTVTTTSPPVTTTAPPVTTTAPPVTTTSPPVTVTTTPPPGNTTVNVTTSPATSDSTDSESSVSGWVYALAGALVVALVAGVAWLLRRRGANPPMPVPVASPMSLAERQSVLLAELEQRVQSGWTIVSQTADTATMQRPGEVVRITVDQFGTLHEAPLTDTDPA